MIPKIAVLNLKTVHFKEIADTAAIDSTLPAAVFVAITQTTQKTLFFSAASSFNLSLSTVSDSTTWIFSTDSLRKQTLDTLVFFHTRKLEFISNACGYTYFFYLDSIHATKNNIDSLRITNYNVTNNANTSHLRIYIHPTH